MAHNTKRAERMQTLSNAALLTIIAAKTLASAAARFELKRRGFAAVLTKKGGWHLAPVTPYIAEPAP